MVNIPIDEVFRDQVTLFGMWSDWMKMKKAIYVNLVDCLYSRKPLKQLGSLGFFPINTI